jgi:ribosome-binding factor A
LRSERPFKRTDRVANEIQHILGKIQTQFIDLSDLGFLTFSRVSISPDLKNVKIFFSVVQKKISVKNLEIEMNNRAKAFRKFLGQELRIKYTPKLKFYYDDTLDYTQKLDTIFHDLGSDK